MNMKVKHVERIWVDVPFRPVPRRNMIRELPHWTIFELCKVSLECGVVGIGETMVFYTWGKVTDKSVNRVIGKPATECMWDDSLGAGLQMALFDAVGRALEVPIHQLVGTKLRDDAFISWWSIDMPPVDLQSECIEAIKQGYTNYKFKARPWFDLDEQLRAVTQQAPDYFEIDLDFNAMCNDSAHGVRILREMEKYNQVKIYETPIPHGDVAGYKHLRSQTCIPLAIHVGEPPLMTALTEDICDGFVVCGGVSRVLRESQIIAAANKVFWLQLTGTGLTATFALQLAAVCSHARWPAVDCHTIYEHNLLTEPIHVSNGLTKIPQKPGLGIELCWDAVEKYRIEPIEKPYPYPDLLIRLTWPSGAEDYYTHGQQYWDEFLQGRKPVFSPGVYMEVVPNDGSIQWRKLYESASNKPF